MYTECPDCQTYFKITPDQLKAAEGKVRCGNCNHVFNALTNLAEKVPADTAFESKSLPITKSQITEQVDNELENVVSSSIPDPELSEFSLPSTAESGNTASVQAQPEAEALDSILEKMSEALPLSSASSDPAKSNLSDIDLSVLTDQPDELSMNPELSSIKLDLSDISGLDDLSVAGKVENSKIDDMGVASNVVNSESNADEINKDINNALDNLFDEEPSTEKVTSAIDPLAVETPISEVNHLSEIDDSRKKQESSHSVAEFDLGEDSPKQKSEEKEPEFDLDDSFLSGEPLKSEAADWEPYDHSNSVADNFSNDNFKLEELAESKTSTRGGASRIMWIGVISALLIVLFGQFMYFKREELAKYPSIRPVVEFSCAMINVVLTCEVPDPRDVDAIVIVERNVVSHPNAKNALLITSVIKSKAEFTQQFPELVLTFSDINQKVLARRIFKPTEYLSEEMDIHAGMIPNLPIKILLEIVDPGESAVNFTFDFR